MSSPSVTRGLLCVLTAVVGIGCVDVLDKPRPPATLPPVLAFEDPTGRAVDTAFAEILDVLETLGNVLETVCGWDPVADLSCIVDQTCSQCLLTDLFMRALRAFLPSVADGNVDGGVDGVAGVDGFADIHRICPGFQSPAVPDPDNGSVDLTVGFTGLGLDPVLWGTATACQYPFAGMDLVLDGRVALVYPERVPFDRVESTPVLFGFVGEMRDGATITPISLALRTRPDGLGSTEILVNRADIGSFVFVISPDGVYLRAAEGLFSCDVVMETCNFVPEP